MTKAIISKDSDIPKKILHHYRSNKKRPDNLHADKTITNLLHAHKFFTNYLDQGARKYNNQNYYCINIKVYEVPTGIDKYYDLLGEDYITSSYELLLASTAEAFVERITGLWSENPILKDYDTPSISIQGRMGGWLCFNLDDLIGATSYTDIMDYFENHNIALKDLLVNYDSNDILQGIEDNVGITKSELDHELQYHGALQRYLELVKKLAAETIKDMNSGFVELLEEELVARGED